MSRARDEDYSQVVLLPSGAEMRRRLPPSVLGMVIIGLSICTSVRSELGLAPWDVFHQGLAERTGISLGVVVMGVGVVVMLAWIPLHQRAGIGTLINVVLIGAVVDVVLPWLPETDVLAWRVALMLISLLGFGVGGGLYIGAALGPGPRDGLMTGIAARGIAVWKVRTVLEVSVLVVGVVLGGTIGVGTVLNAVVLGPITHAALRRFHLPVQTSPQVFGE